jgi:multiple sugar transport system permease protein
MGTASRRPRAPLPRLVLTILIVLSLFYLLAPPAWMLISSISPDAELRSRPPHWIPADPTVRNYQTLFQTEGADRRVLERNPQFRAFPRSFANSVVIALATVAICLVFGSVAAYALARFVRPRARRWVLLALLASRMSPVISVMIPVYMMLQWLRLLDSLSGLIVVYAGLLLPFVIWILEGFYRTFPADLEEAAAIDGCSPVGVFTRIVLPLSGNSLFAAAAFVFISTWSDLIVALILTTTERAWPIAMVMAQSLNPISEPSWGVLNSAGLVAAIVPAALAFALRRTVMRGMLSGAVRG